MVSQLRDKSLAIVSDPAWGAVVVSGHTKQPSAKLTGHAHAPHFVTPHRLTLSAEVDGSGKLYAVVLPERRMYLADERTRTVTATVV